MKRLKVKRETTPERDEVCIEGLIPITAAQAIALHRDLETVLYDTDSITKIDREVFDAPSR